MRKILKNDEQYNENIDEFSRKEGVSALFLFAIMCLCYAVLGYFAEYIDGDRMKWIGIVFNMVISAITIIFVKINKRSVATIGLKSGNNVLSITRDR